MKSIVAALLAVTAVYTSCDSNNPARAQEHLDRGKEYAESKNYSEAINEFSKAIKLNPSYDAYRLRGEHSTYTSNTTAALEDYTRAMEYAKSSFDKCKMYWLRSIVYVQIGDLDRAIAECTKAIYAAESGGEKGLAYSLRAAAYMRRDGKNDETNADSDMRNARKEGVDPTVAIRKYGMGFLYF